MLSAPSLTGRLTGPRAAAPQGLRILEWACDHAARRPHRPLDMWRVLEREVAVSRALPHARGWLPAELPMHAAGAAPSHVATVPRPSQGGLTTRAMAWCLTGVARGWHAMPRALRLITSWPVKALSGVARQGRCHVWSDCQG